MLWSGWQPAEGAQDKDKGAKAPAGADPFLADGRNGSVQASSPSWFGWASPNAKADVPGLDLQASGKAGQKPGEVIAQGAGKQQDRDRVYRERVLVRVYHLNKTVVTRALNRNLKSYGAFHSGVEVYGREWSFGMTFDDWSTGITWNPPGENPDHTYCEALSMGYTTLSPTQVWQLIEEMKCEWRGCTYHLLSRNCHHFSDAFCQKLGVNRIPTWLNDLAGTGAATVDFLDSADTGYDGGEAIADFFGGIRRSVTSAFGGQVEQPAPRKMLEAPPLQRPEKDAPNQRHDPFSALR